MPYVSASLSVSITSAFLQNAFVGMQPSLRQVPPTLFSSKRVTVSPLAAARTAVSYPPGPAPMMMMSVCIVVSLA